MRDSEDIGRPVHHTIDPAENPRPRRRRMSRRALGLRVEIMGRYPGLDSERVEEIVRDRRGGRR